MNTTAIDMARPEDVVDHLLGQKATQPFDAGVALPAFRLPNVLVGRVLDMEAAGAGSVWFSGEAMARTSPGLWGHEGGALALANPDPHALADPIVMASAGLLASRRVAIGAYGIDAMGRDPDELARAAATIAQLAPGRFVLGLRAGVAADATEAHDRLAAALDALARATDRPRLDVVLESSSVAVAELAGSSGAGWLPSSIGMGADAYAEGVRAARRAAGAAGHDPDGLPFGLVVEAVIHDDEEVVADALGRDLVRAHLGLGLVQNRVVELRPGTRRRVRAWLDGNLPDARLGKMWRTLLPPVDRGRCLHGSPSQVVSKLEAFVKAGASRVVLRNLVGLGRPDQAVAGDRATVATTQQARMTFEGGRR